ncbi:amidohydrolase [Vibrio cholerae]|nr:amidohydrolase [Vibrio cholerae]EGR0310330.1 amidohydrolase [Vibrio cholerae]EGR1127615.1 amidohydrolase [Vibrio cholerae]EGR2467877.1 amidohydrolase [Vibrio cholerae]EGR4435086.1 amidohydrolase [Vibrio cholerae]
MICLRLSSSPKHKNYFHLGEIPYFLIKGHRYNQNNLRFNQGEHHDDSNER